MKTIPSLAGKLAVVTGASRSVGPGIATLLGKQDATVYALTLPVVSLAALEYGFREFNGKQPPSLREQKGSPRPFFTKS